MKTTSSNEDFVIRNSTPDDCGRLLSLIKELAEYEKLSHAVEATVATLEESLFGPDKAAEAIIGEYQGEAIAYAIYFFNFSTFTGRAGIYLEDIFVKPSYRRRGYGNQLLAYVAGIAVKRNCPRLEWSVLNWNSPALDFYQSIGAKPLDEWTMQRLSGKALENFGQVT